ncbi:MAG: hypothetical protein O7A66_03880 [Alphaproteobacteria bacterium]|nr:hypothetical protein [Alphaproteobacteria bacterium]
MDWARILATITGTVDRELLSRNEYLVTENRILKRQFKGRLLLSDATRATLGEIGHRLGRKALADVANAAKPDTILGWYPPAVAQRPKAFLVVPLVGAFFIDILNALVIKFFVGFMTF